MASSIRKSGWLAGVFALAGTCSTASADTVIVYDASNSMWGRSRPRRKSPPRDACWATWCATGMNPSRWAWSPTATSVKATATTADRRIDSGVGAGLLSRREAWHRLAKRAEVYT